MTKEKLLLPALRAQIGDWTYYLTTMTLAELVGRVTTASAFHKSEKLDELIQRSLSPRAKDIAGYLLSQPQRFFGALVVGVYGGKPEWIEVQIREVAQLWDERDSRLDGTIGILSLSGHEKLFALDGQHRVAGTTEALAKDPSLGSEEVAVLFVGHSTDEPGLERTRRLFSTLNRYAKPVSKRNIIALDEDDAAAIVTRRLVDSHPLFSERVALGKTKAVPVADRTSFTSIVALYDCVEMILKVHPVWEAGHKRLRPEETILDDFTQYCTEYWSILLDESEVLQAYIDAPLHANPAGSLRGRHGGHLLFRPVGILAHTWVTTSLCAKENADTRAAIKRLATVPMKLDELPWKGLLWDGENRRMITSKEAQLVAHRLLYRSVGGDLRHLNVDEAELRKELAGLLNRASEDVALPRYHTHEVK